MTQRDSGTGAERDYSLRPDAGVRSAGLARLRQVVVLTLLVCGVLWLVVVAVQGRPRSDDTERIAAMTRGGCTFDEQYDDGRDHVASPAYAVQPPAGGDHAATSAEPGAYTAESAPPDGEIVHALEHGIVVVWYDAAAADAAAAARAVHSRFPKETIALPRTGLRTPVAATAWHRRLHCAAVDAAALELFVETFRDRGPERFGPADNRG